MNERVLELAIEARKYAETKPDIYQVAYDKKFAESIIRECIDMVDKVYHEETDMGNKLGRRQTPYQEIVNAIEDHFGVEE